MNKYLKYGLMIVPILFIILNPEFTGKLLGISVLVWLGSKFLSSKGARS